jgi:predicted DNA-binding transcriptional regulator AlpA
MVTSTPPATTAPVWPILGLTELAQRLGISPDAASHRIRRGSLPSADYPLPGGPVWLRSSIDAWEAAGSKDTPPREFTVTWRCCVDREQTVVAYSVADAVAQATATFDRGDAVWWVAATRPSGSTDEWEVTGPPKMNTRNGG